MILYGFIFQLKYGFWEKKPQPTKEGTNIEKKNDFTR